MFEKPLSPTTQAVSNAANEAFWDWGDMRPSSNNIAAAAIRAVADQVAPESTEPNRTINVQPEQDVVFTGAWHIWNTQRKMRSQLLAIATELEGHQ